MRPEGCTLQKFVGLLFSVKRTGEDEVGRGGKDVR